MARETQDPHFPLVGVLGAGPETRLAYAAANRLGLRYRVLARTGRDAAARVVPDAVSGDVGDLHVLQAFAEHCAVVLVADPDVPLRHLRSLAEQGVHITPRAEVLTLLDDPPGVAARLAQSGLPVADAVPGEPGLAVLVARSPSGQAVVYPVAELGTGPGGNPEAVAPAPDLSEGGTLAAQELALKTTEVLGAVGVLAVRLAAAGSPPRITGVEPLATSNAAWTVAGCVTDAFEQHLRAALDLPLGDPTPVAPYAVTVGVLGRTDAGPWYPAFRHLFAHDPGLKLDLYGVDVAEHRLGGHLTVLGHDVAELRERARHAAGYLRGDIRQ